MIKQLAKLCAKIALDYLPDVAVWVVEQATGKTAESEKAQCVLEAVEQVAKDAAKLAEYMKDGKITDTEKEQVRMRASVLAEDIEALL